MTHLTLHMIGNAHIDPVWLWRWQEGSHEVIATFRSVIERMNEDDDFIFSASSAAFYAWVEAIDPSLFKQIQERVQEGRWELVGGWWVEPDCNIPSGESFVRQALYGQRYFQEKFGKTATTGFAPDSFGHHGMLPQLLQKSGMNKYVFMRPHPHEQGLPGRLFWWVADDGSRVLTFRLPFEYVTWADDLQAHVARCAAELVSPYDEIACFYGVGNHGGGPTKGNLASIRHMQADPNMPTLQFSTLERFFASVEQKGWSLPTVQHDLQHHARGCYAVHSEVKALNRLAENRLIAAETWKAIAQWVADQPYPTADFTHAWQGVLFNQFHDTLAGTSIEPAYDDAAHLYGEAISIADRALNEAVQGIAWRINIPAEPDMTPIILFNPHSWEVKTVVEAEINPLPAGKQPESFAVADNNGESVAVQPTQALATTTWRKRIAFTATLPPLGYRVYRAYARAEGWDATPTTSDLRWTETSLENALLRVEVDGSGGLHIDDKALDMNVFSAPAAPYVLTDTSDTWGHDIVRFDGEGKAAEPFTLERVHLYETGSVRATLRVISRYADSVLTQRITLYPNSRQVEVAVTVDWRERFKLLKWRFPTMLEFPTATYEIPYGHVERATEGGEEPGQRWVSLTGTMPETKQVYGVSLLNDAKYSFSARKNVLEMTVLRSPIYAHHIPKQPSPDLDYHFIDQRVQHFRFTLLPHPGDWRAAETARRAAELNQPPVVVLGTYHDGALSSQMSYLSVDADNINVGAVKRWEDGDDLIVRLVETAKRQTATTLHLPGWGRVIPLTFGPCEIKTLRIPRDATSPVVEVNLLEWDND